MGAVILLAAGVVTLFVRPRLVALWVGPVAFALVGLLTTLVHWDDVRAVSYTHLTLPTIYSV